MVSDTYHELSTKNNTQKRNGEDHIKTLIEGFEQYMPVGMKWNELLVNWKNLQILL